MSINKLALSLWIRLALLMMIVPTLTVAVVWKISLSNLGRQLIEETVQEKISAKERDTLTDVVNLQLAISSLKLRLQTLTKWQKALQDSLNSKKGWRHDVSLSLERIEVSLAKRNSEHEQIISFLNKHEEPPPCKCLGVKWE